MFDFVGKIKIKIKQKEMRQQMPPRCVFAKRIGFMLCFVSEPQDAVRLDGQQPQDRRTGDERRTNVAGGEWGGVCANGEKKANIICSKKNGGGFFFHEITKYFFTKAGVSREPTFNHNTMIPPYRHDNW